MKLLLCGWYREIFAIGNYPFGIFAINLFVIFTLLEFDPRSLSVSFILSTNSIREG